MMLNGLALPMVWLSGRIFDLRQKGYNIVKEMSGGDPNYAIYSLGEE